MNLMADLNERIAEIENRIIDLVQRLEGLASLEESLDASRRGLGEASTNIGNLVDTTKAAIESLNSMLITFREAVEVLQRSDPARTIEAVSRVEAQLVHSDQETKKAIGGAVGHLSHGQLNAVKGVKPVIYITFVIVLALLGFEVLRAFPSLLSR